MYVVIFLALLIGGIYLISLGPKREIKAYTYAGYLLIALDCILFGFMSLAAEWMWFENLGIQTRYFKQIAIQTGTILVFLLAGLGFWRFLMISLYEDWGRRRALWVFPTVAMALYFGWGRWTIVAKFLYQQPALYEDPLFGMDISFYFFTFPFLVLVALYLFLINIMGLIAVGIQIFKRENQPMTNNQLRCLRKNFASLLIFFSINQILNVIGLVVSDFGIVHGAGWTDRYIRMPAYLLTALVFMYFGSKLLLRRQEIQDIKEHLQPMAIRAGGVWVLAVLIVPWIFQAFYVSPNEITLEEEFLEKNIEFTRKAYAIENVQEKLVGESRPLTRETVERNRDLFNEVRLWDWRALFSIYDQFQEIRLYYQFADIDIDRYRFNGQYRQVMLGAREISLMNLPKENLTYINRRFKYTHGYGVAVSPVHDVKDNGLPVMLLRDIPPIADTPSLKIERPEIYYGDITYEPVVVNSSEKEFDYPQENENIYTHYQGNGGVQISNLWRKIVYGWKFDGTKFLLSSYPQENSRIMFYRSIKERVHKIAPFLQLDRDPYSVVADGKIHWILDAYTISHFHPYSERLPSNEQLQIEHEGVVRKVGKFGRTNFADINYIRNSVKAVIDAYSGEVKLYVFTPDDPIIKTWANLFPEIFSNKDELPDEIRSHIRYPVDYLLTQGLVYSKYHMKDIDVFYNQEDLWTRATEKYRAGISPIDPYYIMWRRGALADLDFILMMPFTPKDKQLLSGWLAAFCDGDRYGELVSYKFSKKTRILGPQQVESKIDQNPELSKLMTLWDQRGSSVIRGNLLAIPVESSVVYIKPIYLRSETAAHPELRLVIAMSENALGFGKSLADALESLLTESVDKYAFKDRDD